MMKRLVLTVVAVSLIWVGSVVAGAMGNVSGEVTKMDGEMVTIKMADGAMKSVHIDPKGTKKEGKIDVGSHVTADVAANGHANWIHEMKDAMKDGMKEGMDSMKDGMKKE